MIYDCDGNLQAVSGSESGYTMDWRQAVGAQRPVSKAVSSPASLPEALPNLCGLFALSGEDKNLEPRSALAMWMADEIRHAKDRWPHSSRTSIEHNGENFDIRFQTLTGSAGLAGYVLQLDRVPSEYAMKENIRETAHEPPEGSTLITRQQWHDIKNELGGLKLYATFLRKRPCTSEDLEVVNKLLSGINGLIDHLARIRRGETR
ncbi:MAG: hypothetical protein ACREDR_03185 [Blastocatellia bacterium]